MSFSCIYCATTLGDFCRTALLFFLHSLLCFKY